MIDDRMERALAVKNAAQLIARADSSEGRRARAALVEETGLSPEGVDLALQRCLEHDVARSTLSGLIRAHHPRPRAHVLLSANVFVGAFRAILVGLFQSPRTLVRPSRRARTFPTMLSELSHEAFSLVDELSPSVGDPVWAYASDDTIETLRHTLKPGVELHAHGSGMGVAVFRERGSAHGPDLLNAVKGLVADTIVFDQRGCLSPRVVLVEGTRPFAENISSLLVQELAQAERLVPRGRLSAQEQADALRHEATMMYMGSAVVAGMGMVVLDPLEERVLVPPVGRYLHVTVCRDALELLRGFEQQVTTIGIYNPEHLPGRLRAAFGERRYVDMGKMQTPPFDGPVDSRHGFAFETL